MRLRGYKFTAATLAGIVLLVGGWLLFPRGRAQPAGNGKALFERRCGGCHAIDRDKEGPRLGGVYGRTSGSVDSFDYSDALKASGIVWNAETLDKWLANPDQLVPNNNMSFHLENGGERRDIIDYLKKSSAK
jgi:cytochrome c